MKEIPLTQGHVALVDDDIFDYLNQWRWCYARCRKTGYAVRSEGKKPNQKTIRMHRVIMNTKPGEEVDHIDHNGCHNWRKNMRNCTQAKNMMNRTMYKNNHSGFRGVTLDKRNNKWVAQIRIRDRSKWLGYFSTPEEAAHAYNEAAIKLHGEFANINKF